MHLPNHARGDRICHVNQNRHQRSDARCVGVAWCASDSTADSKTIKRSRCASSALFPAPTHGPRVVSRARLTTPKHASTGGRVASVVGATTGYTFIISTRIGPTIYQPTFRRCAFSVISSGTPRTGGVGSNLRAPCLRCLSFNQGGIQPSGTTARLRERHRPASRGRSDPGLHGVPAVPILVQLTLGFVALKITGAVDWSWWIITAPLWVHAALVAYVYLMWWRG